MSMWIQPKVVKMVLTTKELEERHGQPIPILSLPEPARTLAHYLLACNHQGRPSDDPLVYPDCILNGSWVDFVESAEKIQRAFQKS